MTSNLFEHRLRLLPLIRYTAYFPFMIKLLPASMIVSTGQWEQGEGRVIRRQATRRQDKHEGQTDPG